MIARTLGVVAILLLGVAAFTPLPEVLAGRLAVAADVGPAEAIVVLGGDVNADGTLGASSLARAVDGILLERRGLAPLLVLSGDAPPDGPSEPAIRAALARALGVPAERIVELAGTRSTHEEATRAWAALHPRGARRILLVTDTLHLARARAAFERAGFVVRPAPTDDLRAGPAGALTPGARLTLALRVLRETAARAYYRLAGYAA